MRKAPGHPPELGARTERLIQDDPDVRRGIRQAGVEQGK
jgi:hypothetical protein